MSSYNPQEQDSATDSVASSPRSDHDPHPRVRLMCSFGGKILPRPHDSQLRYVGGDTRIVAVPRHTPFAALVNKLSKLSGMSKIVVKYQLPNEDLDALITVTTDEDVENMMEEYERVARSQDPGSTRLRLFLFEESGSGGSISSILDGSTDREQWFFDTLNGRETATPGIERGRSEASSVVSEVPDYLFSLENSDEAQPAAPRDTRPKTRRDISVASDPGSPATAVSSPFGSTSSAPVLPSVQDLAPAKTKQADHNPASDINQAKPEVQQTGYPGNPVWRYPEDLCYPAASHALQQIPVYYVPGSVPQANAPVQSIPIQAQFVQQYPVQPGHIPIGYHQSVQFQGQVYAGQVQVRPMADGMTQQAYYGFKSPAGMMQSYPGKAAHGWQEQ